VTTTPRRALSRLRRRRLRRERRERSLLLRSRRNSLLLKIEVLDFPSSYLRCYLGTLDLEG
jgi:hypothetical protein